MKKIIIILHFVCFFAIFSKAQTTTSISSTLDSLSRTSIPLLNNEVDISFSNIAIKELIRTLGNTTGLNVTIDPGINYTVNANFNGTKAKDVLDFLCSKYKLELSFHGNIIHIQNRVEKDSRLNIEFSQDSVISYESEKTNALIFFKELTEKTSYNFILPPESNGLIINGYAKSIPLRDALVQIAKSNKIEIREMMPRLYAISPLLNNSQGEMLLPEPSRGKKKDLLDYNHGVISAEIKETPLTDVLKELSSKSGYSVCLLSPLTEKISINAKNSDIHNFLNSLFYGSQNTFRIDENVLFAGERKLPEVKSFDLIKLNNRSVDSLINIIPQPVKQQLTIKEFSEQNSFMVWGDADHIAQFRKHIEKVDVVVPVILIDVIIVDAGKNFEIETGLELGIGDSPQTTKGKINEGLDFTMGAESVNKLLGRVGLTNLGKVSPNFYAKLKAMETDGVLEIRSTPQLSTMNGHSATMSIGQTEYYKEELSNIWGTQNPQLQTQKQYKPVEAKLAVRIKPFVTGNGFVSLTIDVEQSDFTERIDQYAPPGIESRKFSSMIRVKNQEMILLGGLEENIDSSTRKGWPFLSKIPVLNWIFTNKSENRNRSHLNIFIKPTVIY